MKTVKFGERNITPSKIICVGRNYIEHIAELANEVPANMVLFMKPNAAISDDLHAFHQEALHYEAELCFVYQRDCLVAVGVGLDLTKRTLQTQLKNKGLPWERAKAFKGSAVFSDFITIEPEHYEHLSLELYINERLIQKGGVKQMIYKPKEILHEIRTFIDLEDNDIIMTGTPKGVGTIGVNDIFSAHVYYKNTAIITQDWQAQ
jgi:2-keto-4-pentenoate hydratase/2-oxohepta-3-ene-1,7-dioic acid hydratase in catechol pathway